MEKATPSIKIDQHHRLLSNTATMGQEADPRMMKVTPRIRYNTIGGVNGPLVVLENVRKHNYKLHSKRPWREELRRFKQQRELAMVKPYYRHSISPTSLVL